MLNENIKAIRKSKGLTQEELGIKLNVVRQTVSKWEKGLSVPDSEMLISISEVLETSVSTLLGETVAESPVDNIKSISEKLEIINLQLSKRKESEQKFWHWTFTAIFFITVIVLILIAKFGNNYLQFDYSIPEYAVLGTAVHSFEWIFVRAAPIILLGTVFGIVKTQKK